MKSSWWTDYARIMAGLTIGYALVASGLEPNWGTVVATAVVTIVALVIGLWREESRGDDD